MDKKINLILDCDPGHDDAIAILLAGQKDKFNLLGISSSSGNQTIEKTSKNTLNIVNYLTLNCEIAKGIETPLIQHSMICPEIHGESGLDGFDFPKYKDNYSPLKGPLFLIDKIMKNDNVVVVITGPMTNFALALRLEPKIKEHIKEVIFMGGSIDHGNVSPASEFNILVDPEAAYIVINSGLNIKMVGLNVTRKVCVDEKIIERMAKINNSASKLFVDLMKVFLYNQQKTFHIEKAPLHDPVTIASLIDSTLVDYKPMNVTIDLSHLESYGRTNCDVFDYLHATKNVQVAMDIDVDKFWNIIEEGIKYYE